MLIDVRLASGIDVTLCGSHELMFRRAGSCAASAKELKATFADRRSFDRRARGEGDELAERLAAAFTPERRSVDRRAN